MERCSLCPGVNNCVPDDLPPEWDGEVLFIGEAPGRDENKKLRVFIGKTGDEVNRHYLPLAGLRRDSVGFTNAIRCLPPTAGGKLNPSRAKDLALLDSCASQHLYSLIERIRPKVLVPLGSFACRSVGLHEPHFYLETQHGFPTETPWGISAFPMYHPALGIHEPKKMLYIRTDWMRLKSYLRGELELPVDAYPHPDYREVTDPRELEELDPTLPLAMDTETKRGGDPYCLTYSQSPGTGRLIAATRPDLLVGLSRSLDRWESPILFHNWLFDRTVVRGMGIGLSDRQVVDTLLFVFHLGNLPQGLKALAWRELGMIMEDFDDVVTPYSRELVLLYYRLAQAHDWPKPEERLELDEKTGLWKMKKPQGMNTKLKRFFTDLSKDPQKDVFGMWEKNWVDEQAMIEERIGLWPGKCISHVPFDQALFYACRDADALYRLWPLLKRMQKNMRKFSQEHWRRVA